MRYLPNVITILRILFTPLIGVFLARHDARGAFPLMFVAGFSDMLDGYLARRFQWQSRLGGMLDPIADKVLAITVYLGLAFGGSLPWWLVWLVLGRDALILAFSAGALLFTKIRALPPSIWGKLSTFFQLGLAGWVIMDLAWPGYPPQWVISSFLWLAVACTMVSGLHYVYIGARLLREA